MDGKFDLPQTKIIKTGNLTHTNLKLPYYEIYCQNPCRDCIARSSVYALAYAGASKLQEFQGGDLHARL
jgi:hypothetical protein